MLWLFHIFCSDAPIAWSDDKLNIGDVVLLEMVDNFYYLGDMLDWNGGWPHGKDQKCMLQVFSVLASSNLELIFVESKTALSCVVYGSKTWPVKMEQELKLNMVRWTFEIVEKKWQSLGLCWQWN